MKKLFTLFLFGIFAGILGAYAIRPDEPKDFKGTVVKNADGSYSVNLTVTAPTKELNYYSDPADLEYIDKLTITRSCYDLNESYVPVTEFDDPAPGAVLTFEDKGVQVGYTYYYYANASIEDETSYSATIYGLYIGIKPAKPAITLTIGDDGMPPVGVAVTAPDKTADGSDLTEAMTITVSRTIGYSGTPVVKTFENVAPGAPIAYDDNDITELSTTYYYKVQASTPDGISDEVQSSIYVGRDLPGAPSAVTAALNAEGGVVLTWEAPSRGIMGGAFLTPVLYKVTRLTDNKVIAEGIEECTATDPCTDLTAPANLTYSVYAYNADGGNESRAIERSNSVVAGPAAALPFHEGFNGPGYSGGPEQLWSYEGYSWDFSKYNVWSTGLQPYGGAYEDGMAYAYFSVYTDPSKEYPLTSCALDFSNALHPVATFHYSPADCDNLLRIESVIGDEVTELHTQAFSDGFGPDFVIDEDDPLSGWVKVYVPLQDLAGYASANIRFVAVGAADVDRNASVYIDEIEIDDYPYAQANADVDNDAATVSLTWQDPSTASKQAEGYTVYVDGEPVHHTTDLSYTHQGEAGKTYKMYVAAHYGDYVAHAPEAAHLEVTVGTTSGLSAITLGEGESSVEFFNLQGIRVDNPVSGSVLIRRATLTDGSVRNAKVVIR